MTERKSPFAKFADVIGSLEEIRAHIGDPVPPVVAKVMDHIDSVSRAIIEKSPFIAPRNRANLPFPRRKRRSAWPGCMPCMLGVASPVESYGRQNI